jgi:predicted DNA-binding protein (MmcQ/YjbR family)
MRYDDFHAAALALPGAAFDVKWGADRTFVVGGRMFAVAGFLGDPAPRYTFKASAMAFEHLVEQGLAEPAPYLGRAGWVRLKGPDALADEELKAYLAQSHALVAAKLPARLRRELGLG